MGGAMLSKSLIQLSVFLPSCLIWGQTMVEVMKIMAPPSEGPIHSLLHSVPPILHQTTFNPCLHRRLLDTHRSRVWVSLLWGHCPFLLGPGVHKVLFVPPRVCPQSCVSSGSSVVGLIVTSSKRAYATPRSTAPRAPAPAAVHCDPYLLSRHSQFCLSLWGLGSWCTPGLSPLSVSGRYGVWF